MITEPEIWRTAGKLVAAYGREARQEAEIQAKWFLEDKDTRGYLVWRRVAKATNELLRSTPRRWEGAH